MTVYRRLLCLTLALCMMIALIPSATGLLPSVYAETTRYGITLSKVHTRVGAGTDQKLAFDLPSGQVCEIRDVRIVDKVTWYKIATIDPERKNNNIYIVYVHGDFFRELTSEEAELYRQSGTVATPTPVPESGSGDPTPTPTPVPSGMNQDLPAIEGSVGSVTAGGTNLREGPGTGYRSIMRLDRNTQVELLTIPSVRGIGSNTFFKVRYDNTVGYIMSDFISIISGGPQSGESVVTTPTPYIPESESGTVSSYTHVKLLLSSCHLRVSPGGDYDPDHDWEGRGSILPLNGSAVKQGRYTWYPVLKDGRTYYVRDDCVQPFSDDSSSVPTATPQPTDIVITPTPYTPEPGTESSYTHVKLLLSSCHLRVSPGGDYDPNHDWEGRGSVLPLNGNAVKQGGYTWYPVLKDGKTYYVRNDCVQPFSDGDPSAPTATPAPTAAPVTEALGWVRTIMGGCNLRATISGTVIKQIAKNVTLPYLLEPVKKNGYTWYFVADGSNRGYLRSDVVKVVKTPDTTPEPGATDTPTPAPGVTDTPAPTADPVSGWIKTTSSGVNLRKKAGYTDVIGRVDKNIVMPYYGEPTKVKGVNWYYVQHSSLGMGYLHADFVTRCNEDGSPVITPTPEPTATLEPGVTPEPSGAQEASYTTLKTGSTGNAVKNLVTELKRQGYYSGSITTRYTTSVADAVRAFQRAKGLSVDGVAGPATQHKLFGTVPIGAGDTSSLTMTLYPAEKIDWYTGGINELWARGSNYKVYDVKTGIVWWAHRWAGGLHVDAEPLTAADTARLCRCYGVTTSQEIKDKNLWQRRPLLVTIGTRTFACSLYGVPHNYPEGDTISTNEFKGQVCIHFTNSKTHDSRKVDSGHEEAIQYAWEHAPNGHQ